MHIIDPWREGMQVHGAEMYALMANIWAQSVSILSPAR